MIKVIRRGLFLLGMLVSLNAMAVTYTFNTSGTPEVSGTPSICSGNWSRNNAGNIFTCSGSISTASGDVLQVSTATNVTLVASTTLTLTGTTAGSGSATISLQSSYEAINLSNSSVSGSVSSDTNITSSNTSIAGNLTSNYGALSLTGGNVVGNVATGGKITTNGANIGGTLTSTGAEISLTGGSVGGLVRSTCCTVTTNSTNLNGGVRADSNSISITGGTIKGDFYAGGNSATFSSVTMSSGTVSAGSATFTNSTLGSPTAYVVVTTQNGAVNLNNTSAYGNFTAPDYSTIYVNSPSTVTGTCLPNSTPANACSPGPVLSWSLDETAWSGSTGEVKDATPNSLHGTVFNGATPASSAPALPQQNSMGTCGYGGFTSSSSQYVQRADNNLLDLQGSFTIGVWVKPRALPSSGLMTILSKDENYEFHVNPNGTINWWWQTTGGATREFNSTSALTAGQWSHVLIRYAAGDQRIYINGALAGQASLGGTPAVNGDPLQLGADQGTAGRYFNGDLDELRIYNTALTPAQITTLYQERHQCTVRLQCFNDDFNDGSLGDDWAVTSRGSTAFTPTVTSQRMRLTSNQGNVSTAATLQRLFPASGNYIQVQFKYYAYNGNGADGVAVVLSDATVTPQPGAFGGPLGYGSRGDAANPGFSGGWLGVGVDEYGNFSTEGGPNGPGQRPDSVAVRGSGQAGWINGYRYIAGTPANLNPGVDISGATAGPGHTYRITLDARLGTQALVTVERDSGSGFVVLPNLSAVNVLAAANSQAALPSDFYLSLTGSTGGSNNVHELDDLQVCATNINPIAQQIDHFEFAYSGTALTCNPQPVTIRACLNSSCSSLYTDPVSVTLNPASYWSAISPATISGNTISFSGGTAQARLGVPTAGTVSLGVQSSVPATKPLSTTVCSTSGCQITYADSALLLQVPNMLAAKPTAATISAVRKSDNALQCVPAFASVTRSISFTSAYTNPASGTQPVVVNGSNVTATPVSLNLSFDATGTAPLTVRYDDAGQMNLSATYTGSAANGDLGLTLVGSDLFVSKPYGLCLQTDSTLTASTSCNDASCALFPGGIRAGDSFPLKITAVGWQVDNEALTAAQLCSGNITTPNFRLDGIGLTSTVVAPSNGVNGVVAPSSYNHVLGNSTTSNNSVSEVGVFTITATPQASSYLDGETVSGGTSALVGRFIPAYLTAVGNASLTPSCGSIFSYQGQPMGFANNLQPSLTVTAKNSKGAVTTNYDRGAFWKLATPGVGSYSSVTGIAALDARLASQGTATVAVAGADNGDGARTYSWTGEQLLYQPASFPSSVDYPFAAKIRQTFLASSLRETDLGQAVCNGSGSGCLDYSYDFSDQPGSNVRLGRLRIGNASGSELQSLVLPLTIESWTNTAGGSFQRESQDTCTALGPPTLDNFTGNLALGETMPTLTAPASGEGSLTLSAPGSGNDGSVRVSFPSSPSTWLQYPWNGTTRQWAVGIATFGTYKGAAPLIFRREVYR
ncbi:DUF6701 domain-containing protein [Aquipseudomonas alcaligenes]|uniref:DUF6701 domain-containing protein n=1 Tax=Aquipseudomonas alcaligenes TaxID=43263 RepID=UPI00374930A7